MMLNTNKVKLGDGPCQSGLVIPHVQFDSGHSSYAVILRKEAAHHYPKHITTISQQFPVQHREYGLLKGLTCDGRE